MGSTVATTRHLDVKGGNVSVIGSDAPHLAVGADAILVGRDAASTLVLADPRVSSVHAELVATTRGVRVRDLGSKNGVWVEGVRLQEGYLTEATSLFVGPVELRFEPTLPETFKLPAGDRLHGLYGRTPSMRELFARVVRAAPTDLTVLIEGETGTGKELVAQALHAGSRRKNGPFVVVDCGAIANSLAEALLFGHVRGSFTGATHDRSSPFVEANGGTLFLDELGELPLELQPKLLRALAEKRIKPVGGQTYVPFDARIVAATRRDLSRAVNEGAFRSDLYFRVAQVRVSTPALRERQDDIPGLVRAMLEGPRAAAYRRITRESMARLLRHDWPGNVRELRNVVEVAVALADDGPIDIAAPLATAGPGATVGSTPIGDGGTVDLGYHDAKRSALARFEKAYFQALLERAGGNIAEISRRAGLQRTHVRRYLVAHGLIPKRGSGV